MSETNKSYRIRTKVGSENKEKYITVNADLIQDYDTFEILSVNIKSKDAYQLHNSNYGVVVGRVIANNGFGIPNAKVSIFIAADTANGPEIGDIYPFKSTVGRDKNGVRYNLLPNDRVDGCHQVVGTFPTKRYALDNDVILEVFDNYYTYTTKTNNAGDYMICGVPVGTHTLHMDLDLSDCGILSQKPRDFVYKGYTIEQFESPTKFKSGTDYGNLSQIFTQDQVVTVNPFWGNSSLGETIGLSRCDIDVNFKFEPTCVFMGSIFSDNVSNGYSAKCIPTDAMGYMDELTTGEGTIEMIRKTPGGSVEEFQIKGNKLINADGVWCYQIPMNLDYMVTDEFGNMVPTDDPEKGIATRASVRFRISMNDTEDNPDFYYRAKVLVPHNPQNKTEDYDYEFGTYTKDDSFRDLFWNNVYSVKSYIPRIQKHNNWKKEKFSGIKHCNKFGSNNPIPYNNIRIKLPLMFIIMCILIKAYIFICSIVNTVTVWVFRFLGWFVNRIRGFKKARGLVAKTLNKLRLIVLTDGLCPDLDNWYFAPCYKQFDENAYIYKGCTDQKEIKASFLNKEDDEGTNDEHINYNNDDVNYTGLTNNCGILLKYSDEDGNCDSFLSNHPNLNSNIYHNYTLSTDIDEKMYWQIDLLKRTLCSVAEGELEQNDPESIDSQNNQPEKAIQTSSGETEFESVCLTTKIDYLIACIEMNLAQEYNVINFDFYNDWINGTIYNPRWMRYINKKVKFLGITWVKDKIKGCMDDTKIFRRVRKYVQQCSIGYQPDYTISGHRTISNVPKPNLNLDSQIKQENNFHKQRGIKRALVFGPQNGGICHEGTTLKGQKVYYLKPCEFRTDDKKTNLYATDIILLGTFNDCDLNGLPKTFTHLTSTSYIMPTNLALTNMDTNGPLYAKDGGTVCISDEPTSGIVKNGITEMLGKDVVITIPTPTGITETHKGPLEKELDYFKGTKQYNISDSTYFPNENVYNDTIAMTEAAGISWNWTGPGQGKIDKSKMYYPGGHFLGLSCINSQTNIKSCINLERICEIGTSMSQRHEDVRELTSDGKLKYVYTVPSGFISSGEITDTDFRSMFATLNKKRLIATKRNPKTGYRFYDFEFIHPINFDGAFNKLVHDGSTDNPYNAHIKVMDENLSAYGITSNSDPEESAYTQTRTLETTSIDYYVYRFGLERGDDGNVSLNDCKQKFLIKSGSTYYLPQYENSYYFYFGLKQGATALDEFNKQFYAECDEIKIKTEPKIILGTEISFCEGKGTLHVITEGLTTPYQRIYVFDNNAGDILQVNPSTQNQNLIDLLNKDNFYIINENGENLMLNFGKYIVTIVDADDIEVSAEINIGIDLFRYDSSIIDFTKPISGDGLTNNSGREIYEGGFVFVENFESLYNGEGTENVSYRFNLSLNNNLLDDRYCDYFPELNAYAAFGIKPGDNYDLCIVWQCPEGQEVSAILQTNITFKDNSDLSLYLSGSTFRQECIKRDDLLSNMSQDFWWNNWADIGAETHDDNYNRNFFRSMFFKENNLGLFDSHVYAVGGNKVLWGSPQWPTQGGSSINDGLYPNIYCSKNYTTLPPGSFLDDTRSTTPTYGINKCNNNITQEDDNLSKAPNDSNCIYQYCAQVYNSNNAVGGSYHGTMKKNDDNTVSLDFEDDYFHEGYGCVFKPLPYGDLKFLTYKNQADLISQLEQTDETVKYGIIYPTFIYPVMKRPFFANYNARIYGSFNLSMASNEPVNTNINSNQLISIHNGITMKNNNNERFFAANTPKVYDEFINSPIMSADTYGLTLTSSVDRIYNIEKYNDNPSYYDLESPYHNKLAFNVIENVSFNPSNTINVVENYNFYDNLLYKYNLITYNIYDIIGNGESAEDIRYFIGCIDENQVKLFNVPTSYHYHNPEFSKYVYRLLAVLQNKKEYEVLFRFKEDSTISVSTWFTTVIAHVIFSTTGHSRITFWYKDNNESSVYANYEFNAQQNLNDNKIDLFLNDVTLGTYNAMWGIQENLPFKPVINYTVRNGNPDNNIQIIKFENDEYYGPDFKDFMTKLKQEGMLYPIEQANSLQNVDINTKHIFGIGVKTIYDSEYGQHSYIYKVYPNPFRYS